MRVVSLKTKNKLDRGRRIRALYKHLRIFLTILDDDTYYKINYRPLSFRYNLDALKDVYKHTYLYKECCKMESLIQNHPSLISRQPASQKYETFIWILCIFIACIVQRLLI